MRAGRGVLAVVVAVLVAPVPAAPAAADEPPSWLIVKDGVTQPVFSLEHAITETVYVETAVDTDRDGRRDRVSILIRRPGETATDGVDVPVIFEQSPYRGEFGSAVNHPVDVDELPQESLGRRGAATRVTAARADDDLPGTLDNDYVPLGYAVVLGASVGTDGSDGCPTVGDMSETLATTAVIDWLGGRARAFDAGGRRITADWTTGAVGMVGVSYDGTLANMAATTGVRGLRTIVPISAISSWYDYYRANGLVVAPHSETQGVGENAFLGEDTDVLALFQGGDARMTGPCAAALAELNRRQDRVTGDFSRFWFDRDYLHRAGGVAASVFVVHGLNDWNVRTKAFAAWWERLSDRGLPRKIWLHNGGHGGPDGPEFGVALHRWFDRWLFGVPNGILGEPRAQVQRPDGNYEFSADWPVPGTRSTRLRLAAANATGPGTLGTDGGRGSVRQRFVDAGRVLDTDDVLIQGPDAASPNRLVYRSSALRAPAHLSGTPLVDLRMAVVNRSAANITAVLVDYGPGGAAPVMVTRGWLDPQNRTRIDASQPVRPGREYSLRFDLQPDDYVFAAGHRIGLVVVSTDHDYTLRPTPGTELTLRPASSVLTLPLVT